MFKEIKLLCDVWTGVPTRKDLLAPDSAFFSGFVPRLEPAPSRGQGARLLAPAPFLPSLGVWNQGDAADQPLAMLELPGYSQETPELSVVPVITDTAYPSSDRTGADTGNPDGPTPLPISTQ